MSLDLSSVGYKTETHEFKYDWKAVALYALGIGAKRSELDYVFEGKGPKVYPTFAVIPTFAPVGEALTKTGGNFATVVHGGQIVHIDAPIPPEGVMKTTGELVGIYDLKKMAQAIVRTTTEIDGTTTFRTEWSILFRGEGGFGGEAPPKPDTPKIPDGKEPDFQVEEATLDEQALLYRLSGDLNPLHADPDFAKMVGFPQGPILHGLATYGFVARAAIAKMAGGDASKLKSYGALFRKPVWPGETIRTEGYDLGGGKIAVRAFAADRPDPVVTGAWIELES